MFDELLTWYDKNKRMLPWRETKDPYRIWLSEIMLQQTRVEAVKGYYVRFLSVFPDIPSLAAGEEAVYMKLWEGLGYYTRVRNLHRGACQITEEYGGRMPQSAKELLSVAGIGEYTAAAIASIAFGEAIPAVDGNLLRIFARLRAFSENIKSTAAKKAAFAFYMERIDKNRPGDFNEALMDLGSGVCTPNHPNCTACPLRKECAAASLKMPTAYPNIPKKKARSIEEKTVFLIHDGSRVLLQKRRDTGLLAGLYEFPGAEGFLTPSEVLDYLQMRGFSPLFIHPLKETKHIFSHKEWHMLGYLVRLQIPHLVREEETAFKNASSEKKGAESEDDFIGDEAFFADCGELETVYSIPAAYHTYRSILLEEGIIPGLPSEK